MTLRLRNVELLATKSYRGKKCVDSMMPQFARTVAVVVVCVSSGPISFFNGFVLIV